MDSRERRNGAGWPSDMGSRVPVGHGAGAPWSESSQGSRHHSESSGVQMRFKETGSLWQRA